MTGKANTSRMRTGMREGDARLRKLAIGSAFAFVLALCGCAREVPEARLRATISGLEQAIEGRDAGGVRDVLAADFIGPGGLDRDAATRMAQGMFLRYRALGVHAGPLDLRMQPEHATARFQAALTGGEGSGLPEAARLYDVETGWRLEDGEWRLVSITWEPRL
jgi:hypothetical protein